MASPLRPPPPDVVSNFDGSGFVALPVVVAAGVCLPLIFLCVFARLFARVLARKWTAQDYLFSFTLIVGVTFVTFSIPLTIAKPYGNQVWDIDVRQLTKAWMLRLHTFAIFTGPVLWLSKTMLFAHLIHIFNSVRWFKNIGYIAIVMSGLVYAFYTCTASIACAPKPDADLESFINGFRARACSGSGAANMAVGILMALVNALADFYLLIATFFLSPTMNATVKERRVIYLMHFVGVIASICSIFGVVYRIKAYHDVDFTGYQIPTAVALILEISISLMIPCMSSFYAIYRHYTYIEINERTTIGTPNSRFNSKLSFTKDPLPAPAVEPRPCWRKTHMSIEALPFRKSSMDYYRNSPLSFREPRDSRRMKALPPTPLPLGSRNNSVAEGMPTAPKVPKSPKAPKTPRTPRTPKTPNSARSMQLPILFERS